MYSLFDAVCSGFVISNRDEYVYVKRKYIDRLEQKVKYLQMLNNLLKTMLAERQSVQDEPEQKDTAEHEGKVKNSKPCKRRGLYRGRRQNGKRLS